MLPRVLAAFYIPALPPERPKPVMQIRTPDGELVDLGEDSAVGVSGPRRWDELLRQMGYSRISRHWASTDVGLGGGPAHLCQVTRGIAQVAATGHAAAHLTTGLLPTCTNYTVLTLKHADRLQRDGFDFGIRAGDVVECEYVARHRLPHVGLGYPDPYDVGAGVDERKQNWRWLQWTGQFSQLTSARLCGVEGRSLGNRDLLDPCVLPAGHESSSPPHSWQLTVFAPGQASSASARAPRGGTLYRRPGQP